MTVYLSQVKVDSNTNPGLHLSIILDYLLLRGTARWSCSARASLRTRTALLYASHFPATVTGPKKCDEDGVYACCAQCTSRTCMGKRWCDEQNAAAECRSFSRVEDDGRGEVWGFGRGRGMGMGCSGLSSHLKKEEDGMWDEIDGRVESRFGRRSLFSSGVHSCCSHS